LAWAARPRAMPRPRIGATVKTYKLFKHSTHTQITAALSY